MATAKLETLLACGYQEEWWRGASPTERRAFLRGLVAGVRSYAWWKDGTEFVGTTGTQLRDVLEMINRVDPETGEEKFE